MRCAQPPDNPLLRLLVAGLVAAGLLAAAWRWTPLADVVTAERVLDWVEAMSARWWTPYALALAYTPASLIMFPRPLLTLAAVVAFGPVEGFAVALGGIVLNALSIYAVGRLMAKGTVERLGGPRLARVGRLLRKDGFVAVATVGLLPVAPFAIEALAFGALRMKLRHVVPGVVVAMLPGMVGTILLADQVAAALAHDRNVNGWIIGGVIAAMAALAWSTRNYWRRLQAAAS